MMKNVCFLLYNLDPGGLETHLLRFIKYAKKDFKCTIIVKKGVDGILYRSFVSEGVDVRFIKTGYLNLPGWIKILNFLRNNKFDAVCDFTSNFAGIYMWLAWLANIPVRVAYYGQSSHHFKPNYFRDLYDRLVNRLVGKYATSIVLNSSAALKFFFPAGHESRDKCRIIFNGIDNIDFIRQSNENGNIRAELGVPQDSFIVIHTGRYDEKKNQKAVVGLARVIIDKYPSVYFIICGKGTEKLNDHIEISLRKRVFALGFRSDIPALLRQCNAFYFPSYTESQPNSLIEALLIGLPFVASNIEPIKEAIPTEYYGQLVDPDDVAGASMKLEEIINGQCPVDFMQLSKWTANRYDAENRFMELKMVLLNIPS